MLEVEILRADLAPDAPPESDVVRLCELAAGRLDSAAQVYAIGRSGQSKLKVEDEWSNFVPLFDTIIKRVPPPNSPPT